MKREGYKFDDISPINKGNHTNVTINHYHNNDARMMNPMAQCLNMMSLLNLYLPKKEVYNKIEDNSTPVKGIAFTDSEEVEYEIVDDSYTEADYELLSIKKIPSDKPSIPYMVVKLNNFNSSVNDFYNTYKHHLSILKMNSELFVVRDISTDWTHNTLYSSNNKVYKLFEYKKPKRRLIVKPNILDKLIPNVKSFINKIHFIVEYDKSLNMCILFDIKYSKKNDYYIVGLLTTQEEIDNANGQ